MKVVNIKKDQTKYKLEGDAFKRIQEASRICDGEMDELQKLEEELEEKCQASKKKFWDAIKQETPNVSDNENWIFNEDYQELGFYLVEKKDELKGLQELIDKVKGF